MHKEFAALNSGNKIAVHVKSVGDFWDADPKSVLFKLAERAVYHEWGCLPLLVREGGTMPVGPASRYPCSAAWLWRLLAHVSRSCNLLKTCLLCWWGWATSEPDCSAKPLQLVVIIEYE